MVSRIRCAAFAFVLCAACAKHTSPAPPPVSVATVVPVDAGAMTNTSTNANTTPPPASGPVADVFPLRDGARYTYRVTFHGAVSTDVVVVHAQEVQGERLYYFSKLARGTDSESILGTSIGDGVYAQRPDGIYTGDLGFVRDLPRFDRKQLQLMLALPARVGAIASTATPPSLAGEKSTVVRVQGVETCTVPAGVFERCVHVVSESTYKFSPDEPPGEPERAESWLVPNVGVVRFLRATGREDVLVSYQTPDGG